MKENFLINKKIYFHIDELSRDAITASAFNKVLKHYDAKIYYGNRRVTTNLLPKFYDCFDLIILPRPAFIKDLINKKNLPPVVIIFTEGVSRYVLKKDDVYTMNSFLGPEYLNGYTKYVDKIERLYLWGPAAEKPILKYYPELKSKIKVIGNPRMDKICVSKNNRNSNKNIGIITRFSALNDFLERKPIDKLISYSIKTDSFNNKIEVNNKHKGLFLDERNTPSEVLYSEAADITTTIELIKFLLKKKYKVHLKIHPRENKDYWKKIITKYSLKVDVADWLIPFSKWSSKMDYVIGPASTTFYDCYRNNTTPICTRYLFKKREYHVEKSWEEKGALMKFVLHPKSFDELENIIKKKVKVEMNNKTKEIISNETMFPKSDHQIIDYVKDFNKIINQLNFKKKKYIFFYEIYLSIFNFLSKFKKFLKRKNIQGSDFFVDGSTIKYINHLVHKID